FNTMALYIPLILAVISIIVFLSKVTLTEKKHAKVVEELKTKLAEGEIEKDDSTKAKTRQQKIYAPADGELMQMSSVVDEDGKPFPGKGFAIKPSAGKIYAPFDGKIRFTFGTKHALEIVSYNDLQLYVYVTMGKI